MRVRKCPFGVAGQYVGSWFVGSVCKASSSVFFSEGFQVESVAVMWERSVSAAGTWLSDFVRSTKRDSKNSSWEEVINALCPLVGQWVTNSLSGGFDSQKEIDLWLLEFHEEGLRKWEMKDIQQMGKIKEDCCIVCKCLSILTPEKTP